jgi:hypothetical protein
MLKMLSRLRFVQRRRQCLFGRVLNTTSFLEATIFLLASGIVTGNVAAQKSGQALLFDGTNDYVEVPDTQSLNLAGALTVSVWINILGKTTLSMKITSQSSGRREQLECIPRLI